MKFRPVKRIEVGTFSRRAGCGAKEDLLVVEHPLTVLCNGEPTAVLLCTPVQMEYLAVGFLFSEGIISGGGDIEEVYLSSHNSFVNVRTKGGGGPGEEAYRRVPVLVSGCGGGRFSRIAEDLDPPFPPPPGVDADPESLLERMGEFQRRSSIFKSTGGAHSAALYGPRGMEVFAEDIGRHNAVDKVVGKRILNGKGPAGGILFVSGRVSVDIVLKAARAGIPLVVSPAAPTSLAVETAARAKVAVAGFVRGGRMNVYTDECGVISMT